MEFSNVTVEDVLAHAYGYEVLLLERTATGVAHPEIHRMVERLLPSAGGLQLERALDACVILMRSLTPLGRHELSRVVRRGFDAPLWEKVIRQARLAH